MARLPPNPDTLVDMCTPRTVKIVGEAYIPTRNATPEHDSETTLAQHIAALRPGGSNHQGSRQRGRTYGSGSGAVSSLAGGEHAARICGASKRLMASR